MSLKTFLASIWNQVKSLFDATPAEIKAAIHTGVIITENIKMFVDSPVADVLTAIIPGELDDALKVMLRAKLPQLLTELKLADSCDDLTDPQAITACAIKVLQSLDGTVKSAFLHNLSVLVAQIAADGELSWSDGVLVLEWYYQHAIKHQLRNRWGKEARTM